MRLRQHLTYANVMARIAVFGMIAGGSAYAISKIHTSDIASKAITAKKLDGQAVKTSKLADGAVTSGKLADGGVETQNLSTRATLPMAGVSVYSGEVRGWFNRFNDQQPTLASTQPGVYELRIPGIDPQIYTDLNLLSTVGLVGPGPQPGEIASSWTQQSDGGDLHPIIKTYDNAGAPADRSFTYLVFYADHGR